MAAIRRAGKHCVRAQVFSCEYCVGMNRGNGHNTFIVPHFSLDKDGCIGHYRSTIALNGGARLKGACENVLLAEGWAIRLYHWHIVLTAAAPLQVSMLRQHASFIVCIHYMFYHIYRIMSTCDALWLPLLWGSSYVACTSAADSRRSLELRLPLTVSVSVSNGAGRFRGEPAEPTPWLSGGEP